MSAASASAWTQLCHRLGRQDASQLRSEASESPEATDQDVRRRLAELLPEERRRLTLRPAEDRGLTGAHLLADLGLALTLEQVLTSLSSGGQTDGAFTLIADANGRSPLHWAAGAGHWATCKVLLDYGGCCMTAVDNNGHTPLDLAVVGGHAKLLESMFSRDNGWRQFLSRHRDYKGRTALHMACRAKINSTEVLALLLDRLEAPGELARVRDEVRGWPAGFYAAERGNSACLRLLAGRPDTMLTSLLVRADDGRSLLHAAAQGGSIEAFEFGISLGLDPLAGADGAETPAHDCARAGHAKLLRLVLDNDSAGSLCGAVELRAGRTPLHCAAESNSADAVRALIDAGHPLDALDYWGQTPAEAAMSTGNHEAAELLEKSALTAMQEDFRVSEDTKDCNGSSDGAKTPIKSDDDSAERRQQLWRRDGRGWTAAHVAARSGNWDTLSQMLSDEPRLLRCLTPLRETLLHAALQDGPSSKEETVKQLLDKGVLPDVADADGETALRLAARAGLSQAFDYIAAACGGLRSTGCFRSFENAKNRRNSGSLLHLAAAGGSVKIVRRLVALRLPALDPLLIRDSRGRLPVHWAARAGSASCLALLLSLEAAAGRVAPQPPSLHHLALRSGSVKTVDVLDEMRVPVLRLDHRGRSLLHAAAAGGSQALVLRLLAVPPPLHQSLSAVDQRGETPAHAAAAAGHPHILQLLLLKSEEKILFRFSEIATMRSLNCETLLHAACRGGCIESAKLLIARTNVHFRMDADNCSVKDEKDEDRQSGHTPAHSAARAGQVALLAELVLQRPEKLPPGLLHAAAEAGQSQVASQLLKSGRCCQFERDPSTGRTVAHCAAASGDLRTLKVVLAVDQDGALVRSTDSAGRTLLHAAAAGVAKPESHQVVRRLLLMAGDAGHPLKPDNDGRTPIDLAVLAGAGTNLAALLASVTMDKSAPALSELTDPEGRGLLHSACLTGRADTVLLLVAKGLSPWQTDAHGLPAIAYAAAAECPDALRALLSAEPIGGPRLLAARAAEDGATLAHVAANANRPAALRLLAAAGLPILDVLDVYGWNPLQTAVAAEAWDAVEALICEALSQAEAAAGSEADPALECLAASRIPAMRTPDGRSLLHLAVAAGQSSLVSEVFFLARLLASASLISPTTHPMLVADRLGLTPLHEALFAGWANIARLLLALAPSPVESACPSAGRVAGGWTCLHLAVAGCARHGSVDAIRLCQELWPWQAAATDTAGKTPSDLASEYGCEAALKVLQDASELKPFRLSTSKSSFPSTGCGLPPIRTCLANNEANKC